VKALVTGGGGFLGSAIVGQLIKRGDHVRILARSGYPALEALGAEGIQGDICNPDDVLKAVTGVDAVFHTAALAGACGDLKTYRATNVGGTQNVIDACESRGVKKLIYTSSPSVVFDLRDGINIDESTPYPKKYCSTYSQSKAEAEQMVLSRASRMQGRLWACSIRPHLIWGPGDKYLLPRIIASARKGQLRIIGGGRNKVDLTYVENAAHAHLLACDAMSAGKISGEAYFITDGQPVVLWEWINTMLRRLNLPSAQWKIPAGVAAALGLGCEIIWKIINMSVNPELRDKFEPMLTRFVARSLSCTATFNIDKARRDFGYAPIVGNEEGMERTVAYFREVISRKDAKNRAGEPVSR